MRHLYFNFLSEIMKYAARVSA